MIRRLVRRYPLASFFAIAYGVSALALVVIGPPTLVDAPRHVAVRALLMFPVMVITVGAAGGLSAATGGRAAVTTLLRSGRRCRVSPIYYAALLVPPAGILTALLLLRFIISPAYALGFSPPASPSVLSRASSRNSGGVGLPTR